MKRKTDKGRSRAKRRERKAARLRARTPRRRERLRAARQDFSIAPGEHILDVRKLHPLDVVELFGGTEAEAAEALRRLRARFPEGLEAPEDASRNSIPIAADRPQRGTEGRNSAVSGELAGPHGQRALSAGSTPGINEPAEERLAPGPMNDTSRVELDTRI